MAAQRNRISKRLENINKFTLKFDIELGQDGINELKSRLDILSDCWEKYEDIEDASEEDSTLRDEFESLYHSTKARITTIVDKWEASLRQVNNPTLPSPPVNGTPNSNPIHLKPIDITPFNGDYDKWVTYKDTFVSMIHNNKNLTPVEKFYRLRSSLRGEPLSLLENLETSNDNYIVAWDLITSRYENKRIIVSKHVKSLFDIPKIEKPSALAIRSLSNNLSKHLNALKALQLPTDHWDALVIHLIVSKLDFISIKEWENSQFGDTLPTLSSLTNYLLHRSQVLEAIEVSKQGASKPSNSSDDANSKSNSYQNPSYKTNTRYSPKNNSNTSKNSKPSYAYVGSTTHPSTPSSGGGKPTQLPIPNSPNKPNSGSKVYPCYVCQQVHRLYLCPTFLSMNAVKRHDFIESKGLCSNCFSNFHKTENCNNSYRCKVCRASHHTLLHQDTIPNNLPGSSVVHMQSSIQKPSKVLLATALVDIVASNGFVLTARALLDSAAQGNFISESLIQKLKLPKYKCMTPVYGLGECQAPITFQVNSTVKSRVTNFELTSSFYVMKKITSNLPQTSINLDDWKLPPNLLLADPVFNVPQPVDLLIGAEYFLRILSQGKLDLSESMPILQNTQFGWILSGKYEISLDSCVNNLAESDTSFNFLTVNLDKMITKFWELESLSPSKPQLSQQDSAVEKFYETTTQRLESGVYQVRLPFVTAPTKLGNSYDNALKYFYSLEKRFSKNPKLHEAYSEFIGEYKSLNHLEEVPPEQLNSILNNPHYFFPHHAVLKEKSLTTKLRVVFNGSMPTSTGVSLNDILAVGPLLLNDSFEIMIRFRAYKFALISDVAKMFRQIKVQYPDTNFQLILWRNHPSEPIKVYRLLTVTYGTASAPYLAIRTTRQLATDEATNHPLAYNTIVNDFFMDDCCSGAQSVSELIKLKEELMTVFQKGGMELRKWCSDYPDLEFSSNDENFISLSVDDTVKTLGMYWQLREDTFKFQVEFPNHNTLTKRTVVSDVCRIFDPLGLLGPLVMRAKLFIRSLWLQHIDWDQELPTSLKNEWSDVVSKLGSGNEITIPRFTCPFQNPTIYELHGFCDASELGYGACVYVKSINSESVTVHLLCSKSRVAPTKVQSIPRLELCGAMLLSELISKVREALTNLKISKCFLWTDAMIVLHWINSDSCRWKTFISNRVSKIQEMTEDCAWLHIPSESNPADMLSRGITELTNQWWFGPPILLISNDYPIPSLTLNQSLPEPISVSHVSSLNHELLVPNTSFTDESINVSVASVSLSLQFLNISKFETWTHLLNTISYVLRFIQNIRLPQNSRSLGSLSVKECAIAKTTVLILAQSEMFPEELKILKADRPLPSSNRLTPLCPFIDKDGLLRVGGRLKNSDLTYNQKHQILLSSQHPITVLIVQYYHKISLHSGPQGLLYSVRQAYWPIKGKYLCKSVVKNCLTCFKVKPTPAQYQIGELPSARVSVSKPFSHTGLDFAGPIQIKQSLNRNAPLIKAYICVMVCFATKAVHLEAVSDLSTNAFLAAFRRFVSRRGYCQHVYCDNGTNFLGAKSTLEKIDKEINTYQIEDSLKSSFNHVGITFHFNPSRSPSMGGLWESFVKQVKHHLRRTMGLSHFTFEELTTILTQIEAQLNSRPLTPMSDDPNDLEALCPGHFLVGEPLIAVPSNPIPDKSLHLLTRWQRVQLIQQQFWSRWTKDYLVSLQNRSKWRESRDSLNLGTLVLLMEDNLPPLKWSLGRVVELHPGRDNITRVATVKTPTGLTRRAINRLCPLPIYSETD